MRFTLEIQRGPWPSTFHKFRHYDDDFGCEVRGVMARLGWVFVRLEWKV